MMNILFISHTGGRGGGETVLLDVIRTVITDKDNTVFIALSNDGNDAFVDGLGDLAQQCMIERFSYRPVRNTLPLLMRNLGYGLLLGLPKLVRFIKANKIDVVYVNSSVNVIGVMAARKADCKYIWHIHEQSTAAHRWSPKWFNVFYKKWLFDERCKSVFVSRISYDIWLNDLNINQIPQSQVLYSPFKQINRIEFTENRPFTFGYIGSLTGNKNVARLIEAFNLLPKGCKLIIGGSGESESKLKTLTRNNAHIKFLGHVHNLKQFYGKIDCLVIPSLNESWGLVALEAMSAKVPVIITKNSGLVELFNNENECIFVNPMSVEEITQAMKKIAENPYFAHAMSESASKKLADLDINNNFAPQILSIINERKA